MSPCKTVAKKASKRPFHSTNSFRDEDVNNVYIEYYKDVVIIVERDVDLVSLENTFWRCSGKGHGPNCLIHLAMYMIVSSRSSLQMLLWKMIISIVGSRGKSSPYPWSQSKSFLKHVQWLQIPLHTMMGKEIRLSLLSQSLEARSKRSPCTQLNSLCRWEHWRTSWSSTSIRWRIWQHCHSQGPFFFMISSLTMRLIYVPASTTFSSSVFRRGSLGPLFHSRA